MPGSFGDHDSKHSVPHDDLPASPCYISSRSADVILSDVRPTKLSSDALNAVNAFLDELLYTILSAVRTLTTAELRAALHKVLPTTLGKEAVLEAELELRAYWERTSGVPGSGSSLVVAEDIAFNLQWTFELLRLRCEAYSTLSDTDENSDAETLLFQRMNEKKIPSPKQTHLAPASLYLTAIIESICEHIVSNVGRVAARDSSRAVANGQDLFIALCEDSSIYGLFKNMEVYGRIEALSKTLPRSRRSISVAHEDDGTAGTGSFRRNGSLHRSRTRLSSDSINNASTPTPLPSRPSIDRPRPVKTLYNKLSQDFINPVDPGHRKMDSFASANTKQSFASKSDRSPISPTFSEDTRSQEFDDMMRSGSTMKVSLTPDRLRTMEALNKEKEKARANGRQKAPPKTEKSDGTDTPPSHSSPEQANRTNRPTSTAHRAASIVVDEDNYLVHKPPPTSRPRQLSAATASSYTTTSLTRVRASSTTDSSAALSNMLSNKHTLSESNSGLLEQRSVFVSAPGRKIPPQEFVLSASRPSRTRTVARSRASLNLEDVMTGSDDDGMGGLKSPVPSPKQRDWQRGLSASTKELIAFLAEGPPELTSGDSSLSPLSPTPKKSGRLQKMISRITLASETVKPTRKVSATPRDAQSKSMTNLSPLANRPVPPRYAVSGPPSASPECDSADQTGKQPRQRAHSHVPKPLPDKSIEENREIDSSAPAVPSLYRGPNRTTTPVPVTSEATLDTNALLVRSVRPPSLPARLSPPMAPPTFIETADTCLALQPTSSSLTAVQCMPLESASSPRRKIPLPPPKTPLLPLSVLEHACEMRTMLEHATSAAECRIIVDMFLARSKLVADAAFSAPSSPRDSSPGGLESAIVELFLGDNHPVVQCNSFFDSNRAEPGEILRKALDSPSSLSLTGGTAEARKPR